MGRYGNHRINAGHPIVLRRLYYASVFIILKIFFFIINNRSVENPHDFTTFPDDLIPFIRFAVIPYVYWYFFLAFGLVFLAVVDHRNYFGLLGSIYIGEIISFSFYLLVPSTTQRPQINRHDFFSRLTDTLYRRDAHMNCLPSLHIMEAILVVLFLLRYNKRILMGIFAWTSALLIILSTLLIKQHALLDIFVTVILSFFVYYLVTSDKILNNDKIKKLLTLIIPEQLRQERS